MKTVKGFEALSLLRQLSTRPHILKKSGLSLFQGGVVIPKSRQPGPVATSAAVSPMAGAHLSRFVTCPPWMLCVPEHSWMAGQGRAGSPAGQGRRVGSVLLSVLHAGTELLSVSGVLAGDGQGQGGLPAQAGWNPSSARGVWGLHAPVVAAIRSGTMVLFKSLWVVLCCSFPLPSRFEVPTEQYRMNVLGFPDMALFCSSSTSAPTPHKPPRPLLLTSGPVLESLAGAERAGHPQPERRRPEGWEPPWLSLRRRRRWSSPGWHQTCKAR